MRSSRSGAKAPLGGPCSVPINGSGAASAIEPFTSRPVAVKLGSRTVSSAADAVESTLAVMLASYALATPGTKVPNDPGEADRQRQRRRDRADDVATGLGHDHAARRVRHEAGGDLEA